MRVPSAKVKAWFPPETPLRGMPAEEFESLVRAASAGLRRQERPPRPRLLRARHSARWEAGVLRGRSEFVIEPSGTGPARVELEPWTPAILPPEAWCQPRPDGPAGADGALGGIVSDDDRGARLAVALVARLERAVVPHGIAGDPARQPRPGPAGGLGPRRTRGITPRAPRNLGQGPAHLELRRARGPLRPPTPRRGRPGRSPVRGTALARRPHPGRPPRGPGALADGLDGGGPAARTAHPQGRARPRPRPRRRHRARSRGVQDGAAGEGGVLVDSGRDPPGPRALGADAGDDPCRRERPPGRRVDRPGGPSPRRDLDGRDDHRRTRLESRRRRLPRASRPQDVSAGGSGERIPVARLRGQRPGIRRRARLPQAPGRLLGRGEGSAPAGQLGPPPQVAPDMAGRLGPVARPRGRPPPRLVSRPYRDRGPGPAVDVALGGPAGGRIPRPHRPSAGRLDREIPGVEPHRDRDDRGGPRPAGAPQGPSGGGPGLR